MEPGYVVERQVISSDTLNVAIERPLTAPSEENTLAIAKFDYVDQRINVDRGVSRSKPGICHF